MMNHQVLLRSDKPARGYIVPQAVMLAACLMLCGCTVGPNFHRPGAPAPKTWLNATTATVTLNTRGGEKHVELANWWHSFNDPVLNELMERGVATNFDLKIATERVRQARAVVGQTTSAWWPSADVSGSYQRSHTTSPKTESQFDGGNGGQTSSPGQDRHVSQSLYQAGFDSFWELDIFGGTRREVEAAWADAQASVESLRDALVTVTAEIGADYLDLRGRQEQLRITRENLKTQQNTAEITHQQHQAGFISELDVANAEAQVKTTQAQIPALEASIKQSIYQLGVLLGQEPGALMELLSAERPLPAIPEQIPAGLPSDLLERRPDIRGAEASLHATTARIGVAVAELFPKFTLNGSMSLSANKLASWEKSVTSVASFGPSVSWNIFNGWLTRNRIEENKALADQSLWEYRKTILNAFQEVESNWVEYEKQIERGESLEEAVERNRRAAELSRNLYREGERDFLTVLVTERSLLTSQDALIQSRLQAARALVAVYKALGGGWEMEEQDTKLPS